MLTETDCIADNPLFAPPQHSVCPILRFFLAKGGRARAWIERGEHRIWIILCLRLILRDFLWREKGHSCPCHGSCKRPPSGAHSFVYAQRPAAKQAAEKTLFWTGFVKGHDFSRADKSHKINGALAPEGYFSGSMGSIKSFFRSLFSPCRISLPKIAGAPSFAENFSHPAHNHLRQRMPFMYMCNVTICILDTLPTSRPSRPASMHAGSLLKCVSAPAPVLPFPSPLRQRINKNQM